MASILVADDNPLSLAFLLDVVRGSGHGARGAADGLSALTLARAERFDLVLLDLAMPGLGGVEVLQHLRSDTAAASHDSPAIATSAELDASRRRFLHAQGFVACLEKPVDVGLLRALLQGQPAQGASMEDAASAGASRMADAASPPLLDEEAGLRATGDTAVLAALRGLFAQELDALPEELADLCARGDRTGWRDRLHRLRASCGFCGAVALDSACQRLRDGLRPGDGPDTAAMETLLALAAATRSRLPNPPA